MVCFSSEVIATPKGNPPAELLVEIMNREQLYFSKQDVESQKIISPDYLMLMCTLAINGVHATIIRGWQAFFFVKVLVA